MKYVVCPYCGAHLDPGERCDCRGRSPQAQARNGEAAWRTNCREYKSPVARRRERIVQAIEGAIFAAGGYGLAWVTWWVIRLIEA